MRGQLIIHHCIEPRIGVIIQYTRNAHCSKYIKMAWLLYSSDITLEIKQHAWGRGIDPWLVNELYLHKNFEAFFNERSGGCVKELYPTVTIRQIMFGFKMKPLPRERCETCFDRKFI